MLDEQASADLTWRFANSGATVWNVDFIKTPLLESSYQKCAYCETKLDEESKYMEVEHFRCKRDFPEKVVEWLNLLPSCKRCNGSKSDYNVEVEGQLINPYDQNPVDHIYLSNYRLRWRDDLGRRTIETIHLNDTERLVSVRLRVGESVAAALDVLRNSLEEYIDGPQTTRRRNQIVSGIRRLLELAQRQAEYSAVSATVLLRDPNYDWIKSRLVELGLWGDLHQLEEGAVPLCLDP